MVIPLLPILAIFIRGAILCQPSLLTDKCGSHPSDRRIAFRKSISGAHIHRSPRSSLTISTEGTKAWHLDEWQMNCARSHSRRRSSSGWSLRKNPVSCVEASRQGSSLPITPSIPSLSRTGMTEERSSRNVSPESLQTAQGVDTLVRGRHATVSIPRIRKPPHPSDQPGI